jgi:hypothetical protein
MKFNKYKKNIFILCSIIIFFIIIYIICDILVQKKIINYNCHNKKYLLFDDIQNTLKTGDIIQLKICKSNKFSKYLKWNITYYFLKRKKIFHSMYYHSFIVLKQNNLLYGIDFVPTYYSKYKSNFLRHDNQGIRIFIIKDYLKQYYDEYQNISRVLYIKKELDNTKILNIVKTLKNKKFHINGIDILFKINEDKKENEGTFFCTEFIAYILKKLNYLPQNFKTYYFTPEKIINLTKKPYNLYTLGPEFRIKND